MKPFYELKDFPDRKVCGKSYIAVCPICGKRKLHIGISNGLYNCFYADCPMKGILKDFLPNRLPEYVETAGRLALAKRDATKWAKGDDNIADSVPMIPQDYKMLSREVTDKITLVTNEETTDETQLAVRRYLADQHISIDTAMACHVGCAKKKCYGKDEKDKGGGMIRKCIVYTNFVNGKPVNAKYRSCEKSAVDKNVGDDGQPVYLKQWSQDSPTTPCAPYNIDCINPLLVEEPILQRVIITEGEKDVLTLREAGFEHVLSVPNGASSDVKKSFEAFESWLEPVKDIVVCGDSDRAGRCLSMKLLAHFGAKALYTTLPEQCKDISEVMQMYGREVVREIIESAHSQMTPDIVQLADRQEGVFDVLQGNYDHGYDVGNGPLTDAVLHPTEQGGLMIVTGMPNAGKTDFLNNGMCRLMAKKKKSVCFLSFEKPNKEKHFAQFVKLILGKADTSRYTIEELRPVLDFLHRHMVHLDLHETPATPDNVIARAEMVMRERTLDYLVIDPYLYMSIDTGRNTTETQAIKSMLSRMQAWGHQHHVWVVIVAHPHKLANKWGGSEMEEITMYSIAGSANWGNMGDFIMNIERVKKPECDFTRMTMLKVRDQDECHPGTVLYVRQHCGRYDERESEKQIVAEALGRVMEKDTAPWKSFPTD
jgi:twinkle protein